METKTTVSFVVMLLGALIMCLFVAGPLFYWFGFCLLVGGSVAMLITRDTNRFEMGTITRVMLVLLAWGLTMIRVSNSTGNLFTYAIGVILSLVSFLVLVWP